VADLQENASNPALYQVKAKSFFYFIGTSCQNNVTEGNFTLPVSNLCQSGKSHLTLGAPEIKKLRHCDDDLKKIYFSACTVLKSRGKVRNISFVIVVQNPI
jgi:hypothetical protein